MTRYKDPESVENKARWQKAIAEYKMRNKKRPIDTLQRISMFHIKHTTKQMENPFF
jgi:hypothetical protein